MENLDYNLLKTHHKKILNVNNEPYGHCSTKDFFPNYLMHTVFPFKNTKDERRSISFNAYIDNDIYNVYGKA